MRPTSDSNSVRPGRGFTGSPSRANLSRDNSCFHSIVSRQIKRSRVVNSTLSTNPRSEQAGVEWAKARSVVPTFHTKWQSARGLRCARATLHTGSLGAMMGSRDRFAPAHSARENRAAIRKRVMNPGKNKVWDSRPECPSCLAGDSRSLLRAIILLLPRKHGQRNRRPQTPIALQ